MKTLPSGWSTYLDLSFNVAYLIKLDTVDGSTFRWGSIGSGQFGSWAGASFEDGRISADLEGNPIGLGAVSHSIDLRFGGGIGIRSGWVLTLINQDDYFDNVLSVKDLDNSTIECKMFILEVTPTQFSDGLTKFKGVVRDYRHDKDFIIFECMPDEGEHTEIPRTRIEEESFPTFTIPDNSNGQPIPMQWGEREKVESFFVNADVTVEAFNDGTTDPSFATAGSTNTLTDSAQTWVVNEWAGKDLEITGGTGKGQVREIKSNTANILTTKDTFQTDPVADVSVYQITDTQHDLILSDQEIKAFLDADGNEVAAGEIDHAVWFWDRSAEIYVSANPLTMSFLNDSAPFAGQAAIRFLPGQVGNDKIQFLYPYPFNEFDNTPLNWSGSVDIAMVNPDNAIDFDPDTSATATVEVGEAVAFVGRFTTDLELLIGSWDQLFIYATFEQDDGADSRLPVRVYAGNKSTFIGISQKDSGDSEFMSLPVIYLDPPSGFAVTGTNVAMNLISNALVPIGDWGTLNFNRWFICSLQNSAVTPPFDAILYEVGICFAKTVDLNDRSRFFYSIKGRIFGDTWSARKTAANLIEQPNDVVEKILRDDLSIAGADINTDSFDTVDTNRSSYKMSYSINKEINSLKEIDKICEEAWMVYYKNYDGKHTLRHLATSGSSVKTIQHHEILVDLGSNKPIFEPIRRSPLDLVFNEFYVRYDKDPATGEFHGLRFIKNPDGASSTNNHNFTSTLTGKTYWELCQASFNKFGLKRTKTIELDRVSDTTTAENILKLYVSWFINRKKEVQFTSQLELSELELIDIVTLDTDFDSDDYYVYSITEDLNTNTTKIKLREL